MDPKQFLERFSFHLKHVIAKAISLAHRLKHDQVTPVHLFAAIYEEKGSIAADILEKFPVKKDDIIEFLAQIPQEQKNIGVKKGDAVSAVLPALNESSRIALEKTMLAAYENKHSHVGTEHLLYGLMLIKDELLDEYLQKQKISREEIKKQIEGVLSNTSKFPDMNEVADMMEEIQQIAEGKNSDRKFPANKNSGSAISVFTIDLTSAESQKNIDPVIGREKEIERLINILSRRNKNNPVLIGEPGVGKTAIVEGLAKKIFSGDVPDALKNKKILALDMALLISGTIYRGEFEARLKQIIDEVSARPDCFLFIDEIHNIIGAGSNQGTMDAANILKPALARGVLRCIGATTFEEYKKYISSDPALERRFQELIVNEPNRQETVSILSGVKKYYENFHNVLIDDETIETAVNLSEKYIHDRFFPDKALDLLDEACAGVKVKQKISDQDKEIAELKRKMEEMRARKDEAVKLEKFSEAKKIKEQMEKLEKKISALEKKNNEKRKPRKKVSSFDVAKTLSNRLNIRQETLLDDDWARLASVSQKLKKKIIGQDEAIDRLISTLRQASLSLGKPEKPHASLFFVGPSGTGKTELAKILAEELYQNEDALIKIDMSEFSEGHSISKLLGSPAGYVGYKERNPFLEKIKKKPYSVILFDELDKAHENARKVLLQMLDEGTITDSAGAKIHFNHAIIIATANTGSELFKSSGIGFGENAAKAKEARASVMSALKEEFGPSLTGRFGSVCLFTPLSKEQMAMIAEQKIAEMSARLNKEQKMAVSAEPEAIKSIVEQTFNPDLGARNLEQAVADILETLLTEALSSKEKKQKYTLKKDREKYQLV